MNLSTHDDDGSSLAIQSVPSHMPLGVDGYLPSTAIARQDQDFTYRLPLMSPSRGKIVLRRDGVEELSSRPNNHMPRWSAPSRGRQVINTGGMAQQPLNSYSAGQVNVNSFLANSDLTALAAAQFVGGKSPRYSQSAGD